MDLKRRVYTTEINGAPVTLEVSELARKANAAVIGRYGETVVLATVVASKEDKATDFFPLTVDYEERFYAAGKIIGSRFIRREGRPSDEAILSARLIDRAIRPLFDSRLRREVQVVVTVLAYDEKHDPDTPALLATSLALSISDIPWSGPVAGIRYESFKDNGRLEHQAFFAGPKDKINMIEFEGDEVPEAEVAELFTKAQGAVGDLVAFQEKIRREIGKPKAEISFPEPNPELTKRVLDFVAGDLEKAVREKTLGELKAMLFEHLEGAGCSKDEVKAADYVFENEVDHFVHERILTKEDRPDGRALDELRELHAEVRLFDRTHGSGLFIRGDTQILAVTTLAPPSAEQLVETMETTGKKHFMFHYNFPSFSTGEVGRSHGPGRREIGHGALAAKALKAVIPAREDFPYTIRIVTETLSSNGSTSMASTCAASLSLMDAGVPSKKHVAGIAMGLMIEQSTKSEIRNPKYKILTDIQGPEDHHGDMDLKVAGTREGITAVQMDVKIPGITLEIFTNALAEARKARLQILDVMEKTLAKPRTQVSRYAPSILTLKIPQEKIGEVIGPGGRTINHIITSTGNQVTIDIEQDGLIYFAGQDPNRVEEALKLVEQIVREYKPGEVVEGTVMKILDFGAIVDLGGGQDGMVHISELGDSYVKKVEDVVRVGDHVKVKVIRVEPEGRIALSMKNLKP